MVDGDTIFVGAAPMMSLQSIQLLCMAIVACAVALLVKRHGRGVLLAYATLAIAGWVGEETCIRFYKFYSYSDDWWLHLDCVPLLITLIWPLVILSARDVARALGASSLRALTAAVFAIVVVDASMVEIIAVAGGMWSWAEPGYLGVPLIGILGWGFFAGATLAWIDYCERSSKPSWIPFAIVVGPVATHALLVVTWWACFRWTLRGVLAAPSWTMLLPASCVVAWLVASKRTSRVSLGIQLPRMIAAMLFFAIVATLRSSLQLEIVLHTAAVASMYLVATEYRLS
jgi:uncharacterized membrane protein